MHGDDDRRCRRQRPTRCLLDDRAVGVERLPNLGRQLRRRAHPNDGPAATTVRGRAGLHGERLRTQQGSRTDLPD